MAEAIYKQAYIPERVTQQADLQQLGQFSRSYKSTHPLKLIAMVIGSVLLSVVVVVVIAYLIQMVFYVTVWFPIIVILYVLRKLLKGYVCVYMYANGMVWTRGRRCESVRWEQIESIWRKKGRSWYVSQLTCTLRLADGRTLKIDDGLKAIGELAMIVQNEFRRVRLPAAIDRFERGEAVTFGKIQIDHQGVSNGKELVPWDQLDGMMIKDGLVFTQKHGRPMKWSKVKEAETPNLYVLGSLVDHVIKFQSR